MFRRGLGLFAGGAASAHRGLDRHPIQAASGVDEKTMALHYLEALHPSANAG